MRQAEKSIVNSGVGGSLGDRISAFVEAIAESGLKIPENPPWIPKNPSDAN